MTGDKNDLITYRANRSKETLGEAKTMIDNGYWVAAPNVTASSPNFATLEKVVHVNFNRKFFENEQKTE